VRGFGSSGTSGASWIHSNKVEPPADLRAAQERFNLGAGELSTLLLAKAVQADVVVLNDLGSCTTVPWTDSYSTAAFSPVTGRALALALLPARVGSE
jgi:hypothetical protein